MVETFFNYLFQVHTPHGVISVKAFVIGNRVVRMISTGPEDGVSILISLVL